jgi:uncharacterized phage protein (TIGR01671 family)
MNREIKYEAWHEKAQQMITWRLIYLLLMGERIRVHKKKRISYDPDKLTAPRLEEGKDYWNYGGVGNYVNIFIHPDFKLREYTGLKDKNGKEIYEDDWVRWEDSTYEIRFSGLMGWMMKDDRPDYDCPGLYPREMVSRPGYTQVEVVGNIYEEPDLARRYDV